jgi:LAO/AO transport system kinase
VLAAGLIAGDRASLGRAITLVESSAARDRADADRLLDLVLPRTGGAIRLGVTGVPGVGKSTFIESFGLMLCEQGKKVAVLAIDPSSPVHGGSILGDKTRMAGLALHDHAFIRPSPSGGSLGGTHARTREAIRLCEAAGYDVVIVETVGVGQSEVAVASMVDHFLVLLLPNAGDDLQGIKKGIIELADMLAITKADLDLAGARRSKRDYEAALRLLRHEVPFVGLVSGVTRVGLLELWAAVQERHASLASSGGLQARRSSQNLAWFRAALNEVVLAWGLGLPGVAERVKMIEDEVLAGGVVPSVGARRVFSCRNDI